MPVYDYRCNNCGYKFTKLILGSEKEQISCPECKSNNVNRLITACNIRTDTQVISCEENSSGG